MKATFQILVVIVLGLQLSACASKLREDTYSRSEARQAQVVELGTVESVREVQIEGTKSDIGATAGGAVGAIGGFNAGGSGSGALVAGVVGSVVGGIAGAALEEGITRKTGVEVTVKMDDGRMLAVVQEAQDNISFASGDRVRILRGAGGVRVTR